MANFPFTYNFASNKFNPNNINIEPHNLLTIFENPCFFLKNIAAPDAKNDKITDQIVVVTKYVSPNKTKAKAP